MKKTTWILALAAVILTGILVGGCDPYCMDIGQWLPNYPDAELCLTLNLGI